MITGGHLGDFWSSEKIWEVLISGVISRGGGVDRGDSFWGFLTKGLLKGVFDHGGSFVAFLAKGVHSFGGFMTKGVNLGGF